MSGGKTGHLETIQVIYDPAVVSFDQLLNVFWQQIDPTDDGGQFVDRGTQYRSAIFYANEKERELAQRSKEELDKSGRYTSPVVTEILPLKVFYKAEAYHQNYHKKNPISYNSYRSHSGRDQYLNKIWK